LKKGFILNGRVRSDRMAFNGSVPKRVRWCAGTTSAVRSGALTVSLKQHKDYYRIFSDVVRAYYGGR
jgi:hypothetical protein